MILDTQKVARYVETREWPATLDRWRPAPGIRPAAEAVAEVRRTKRVLALAFGFALAFLASFSIWMTFRVGYLVDTAGGAVDTTVVVFMVASFVGVAGSLIFLLRPDNENHDARRTLLKEYVGTVALCMSALELDIHAASLDDPEMLRRSADEFLLAHGMEVAAREAIHRITDGADERYRAERAAKAARQVLGQWVENFTNLMILNEGVDARDYIARGKRAFADAFRISEVANGQSAEAAPIGRPGPGAESRGQVEHSP
jgi:hypothetical protein